ncbi:TonB-dependent receptor plug domain-containing protein [Pseudobacteriovorax antillogorgiicola]|uniref:Iron complex outermembrane recepter protein n=1 Tax=Pseudobacteriovorax antillogorgiicola TaxID=1513793 RepID=A0A1Y6BCH8_9BACT|nr:TonB-dependent receptor [Pseudobacteriovorax antillogorgiicola]TCS57337.1 iron complex outermembrane receptor protein [Pseudobacteriovorax antillogorgiicola]SMF02346.1 iron complex outermembrane recepter protein [Pseudobacteriovorax antillogorgiicola]
MELSKHTLTSGAKLKLSVRLIVLFLMVLGAGNASSQDDDYLDLDLEDLLDIEIIELVTKKVEPLMDSSLPVSVLQRKDIIASGATSIPEALRLMPGVIVREQSSGVYDVHIHGYDDVSTNKLLPFPNSTIMLVMIDYRVVYNYFSGGVFWETLPIEIHDVERIELIRGPSSALYGPNAVTGVLNIVTRSVTHGSMTQSAYVNGNGAENYVGGAALSYPISKNTSLRLSVNHSQRERPDAKYYDWTAGEYRDFDRLTSTLSQPDIENLDDPAYRISNPDERYPDPETSLKKGGVNLELHHKFSSQSYLKVTGSSQKSLSQKVAVNSFSTPLTSFESDTSHLDLRLKLEDLSVQISTIQGEQESLGFSEWSYKMQVLDALVDYTSQVAGILIRPELSIRQASYDGDFIDGKQTLSTTALAVFAEKPLFKDRLRLLGAARIDQYDKPNTQYGSYQLSARYKVNLDHIFHTSVSRANRAPFMVDNFLSYKISTDAADIFYLGNDELELMTTDSFSLGYRGRFSRSLLLDLNLFSSSIYKLSDLEYLSSETVDDKAQITWKYDNINRNAKQIGTTLSLKTSPLDILQFNPYLTFQQTSYYDKEDEDESFTESTPELYGGFTLELRPVEKVAINLHGYHLGEQTFRNYNETETDVISAVTILNAKVSYQVTSLVDIFLNGRNLTASDESQYGYADSLSATYFIGINSPAL